MKSFHISRTAVFFILFVLVVFAVLYRPVNVTSLIRASSQCTIRTEVLTSPGHMSGTELSVLSMDDEKYQQVTEVLSTISCRKKLNQLYSSYRHDYPTQSVTASFYDDAENHKMLITIYSDGVCILNNAFVSVKYPGGGAAELYQQLAELGK